MINPSIDKLLTKVDSKYRLVHIAAKRAQQIEQNDDLFMDRKKYVSKKSIGKALEEFSHDLVEFK